MFNIAYDLAVLLATLGVALDGDIVTEKVAKNFFLFSTVITNVIVSPLAFYRGRCYCKDRAPWRSSRSIRTGGWTGHPQHVSLNSIGMVSDRNIE